MLSPFARLSVSNPLRENVPLAPLTTWRIGGPARWYWEAGTENEAASVLQACREAGIRPCFLGLGSNVLVPDEGIDTLVINLRHGLKGIRVDGLCLCAGAGENLPALARAAAQAGLAGFDFLIGIPGTLGGGVVMNSGLSARQQREMADVLESVTILDLNGEASTLTDSADFGFGYRRSAFNDGRRLITGARLRANGRDDPSALRTLMREHLASRTAKQPLDKATAGSTFKARTGTHSAGWYIEQAGLKGTAVGGAMISHKHANWIENTGGASARNVLDLMNIVMEKVEKQFGIRLDPEVRLLDGKF